MNIIYDYALSFLGVPYKIGGRNRLEGLDCSQLCIEILIASGLLPHGFDTTAQGLYLKYESSGELVTSPQFGDLAFFGKASDHISHIGFCLDEVTMLEAGGGDNTTHSLADAIEKSACVRMRPIHFRKDFFCILRPVR